MSRLKRIARLTLGSMYEPLQTLWSASRHARKQRNARKVADRVRDHLLRETGGRVPGGPFAGMQYVSEVAEGSLFPKLAGSYEHELTSLIESMIVRGYDRVINVGSADGYYAVGLARRLPGATVIAIDVDPAARAATSEMARLNDVETRLQTSERLEPAMLSGSRVVIVCDCEGCERDLLDPARFPELERVDMLVELHEFLDPSIATVLSERFRATHQITFIANVARDVSSFSVLRGLSADEQRLAVDEMRPPGMRWVWMTTLAVS
jgi:23S rRNA U2552 (ribose-2'-O)-methylase RlmE/FtsJ